jgi:tetratricopeptide (TPR) repeat protein
MQRSIPFALFALPLILTNAAIGHAQDAGAKRSINLVEPIGRGRIVVTFEAGWQLKALYLKGNVDQYIGTGWWLQQQTKNPSIKDDGLDSEFEVSNPVSGLDVTYSLFPNPVYALSPTAPQPKRPESCRDYDDNLMPFLVGQGFAGTDQLKAASQTTSSGSALATASLINRQKGNAATTKRLFGFQYADPLCAGIRIVKPSYQPPGDDVTMSAALDAFDFEPDYSPTSADYSTLGNLLYRYMKSYASAAVYYQRALDTLPAGATLQTRRVLVDQLSMSYGISGQLKLSRAVNEAAIAADPDYPLYYYNLACDDAEQGKADDAKLHLQQAFDRRANTLPGEHLPDPTTDDSILKLKKNKEFWTYVQSLK